MNADCTNDLLTIADAAYIAGLIDGEGRGSRDRTVILFECVKSIIVAFTPGDTMVLITNNSTLLCGLKSTFKRANWST